MRLRDGRMSCAIGQSKFLAITPHPGEMARLLGSSVKEVEADRVKTATDAAKRWNAHVILKGSHTIIAAPDGRFLVNTTGNAGLSKGGSGDVLTGVLAAMTGQFKTDDWLRTLALGVYLHGAAAEVAARGTDLSGIVASDVARCGAAGAAGTFAGVATTWLNNSGGIASEAKSVVTRSAEETIAWGREFARGLKAPLLVLLTGDLGSGKTTLTKGIVAGLGAAEEEDVTSPTFTLVHVYGDDGGVTRDAVGSNRRVRLRLRRKNVVYHGDLYRIESFHDFETLGLEDAFAKPAVMILEWSEKFPLQAPWPQVRLKLEHMGGDSRRITVRVASVLSVN